MEEPRTIELSEEEIWALVQAAADRRDAFVARALLDLLAAAEEVEAWPRERGIKAKLVKWGWGNPQPPKDEARDW